MKIKLNLKRAGFTLIEMLLVIAIMGILSTMAITTFQKRSESTRMEKAALQMQQLLQAGLTYQVANGKWPNYPASNNNPDFSPYIPVSGVIDPWGYYYSWQSIGGGSGFQVQAQTPDPASAQQLAAKLPNALSSGNSAITKVGLPGQAFTPRIFIVDVGTVNCEAGKNEKISCSGGDLDGVKLEPYAAGVLIPDPYPGRTDIGYPPCPSGYKPQATVALTGFQADSLKLDSAWGTWIARPIKSLSQSAMLWLNVDTFKSYWYYTAGLEGYYYINTKYKLRTEKGMSVSGLYIAYCLRRN